MSSARVTENTKKILRLQALWIFNDELNTISKRTRWLTAHASQPIGRPLHKHEGYFEVKENESILFHERDIDTEIPLRVVENVAAGYDKNFTRLAGGRGSIPPMHFSFDDKTIYFFTRDTTDRIFSGKNRRLQSMIIH